MRRFSRGEEPLFVTDLGVGEATVAPRRKKVLPKTRSPEEWAAFFRCIQTRYPTAARNHALRYLTYLAGLRIGETLALRAQDVDLDRLKVHVTRGKTGERIVPLPHDPKLAETLARWLKARAAWTPRDDLLFVTRLASRYAPARSGALWSSTASGVGSFSPRKAHEWHTCAVGRAEDRSSDFADTQVGPPVSQTGLPFILVPPREFETEHGGFNRGRLGSPSVASSQVKGQAGCQAVSRSLGWLRVVSRRFSDARHAIGTPKHGRRRASADAQLKPRSRKRLDRLCQPALVT
jgi:hypothetical protein